MKLKHFILSSLNEGKTLKELRSLTKATSSIVLAFEVSKKEKFNKNTMENFKKLDNYKLSLLKSSKLIDYSLFNAKDRKVSEISKNASSKKKWCEFYYLLSKKMNAKNILEIGTNLGVSGQYFLKSLHSNHGTESFFLTFEGLPDLCEIADERFKEISKNNFKIVQGFYDETLQIVEELNIKYDIIFIDGNHKFKPTLKYFNFLKDYCNENSIIIFDDINWSDEMKHAWKVITASDNIISIDLFNIGIITFDSKNILNKDFKLFYSA